MADDPELDEIIKEILPNSAPATGNETPGSSKDYRTAELVVNSQPLTEAAVMEFAKAKKLEEIIVSISQLSGLPAVEIGCNLSFAPVERQGNSQRFIAGKGGIYRSPPPYGGAHPAFLLREKSSQTFRPRIGGFTA